MTSFDENTIVWFVGDSDIARWPEKLLPFSGISFVKSGHSGATLKDIVPQLQTIMNQHVKENATKIMLVACAGENDIGKGLALDETLIAFESLCKVLFAEGPNANMPIANRYLIFLGPKLEPWLDKDPASRKKYVKMSKAFGRACDMHERANQIVYVDCLTMFCGDTAHIPGATLGGKAKAEPKYFANDQLHLSDDGYQIWKEVVEAIACAILTSNKNPS